MHFRRVGYARIFLAVGTKRYASVEKDLEVMPDVGNLVHTPAFHHLVDNGQEPGGDSGDIRDIFIFRCLHQSR